MSESAIRAPSPNPFRGSLHSAAASARSFWTGDADLRPLGLMRWTFGCACLLSLYSLASVLDPLFSPAGVLSAGAWREATMAGNFSVFAAPSTDVALWALYGVTVGAVLCMTLGFHTRVAVVVSWFLMSGLYARNEHAVPGASEIFRLMLFWLMWTPCGQVLSVDSYLGRVRGRALPTAGWALPIRLCQLQVAWIYFAAGVDKWTGTAWRNGTAVSIICRRHLDTGALCGWLAARPLPSAIASEFTLVVELGFAFLVFWPARLRGSRVKAVGLALGLALHLAFLLAMDIPFFSLGMLATYPIFFSVAWLGKLGLTGPAEPPSPLSTVHLATRAAGGLLLAVLMACAFLDRGCPGLQVNEPRSVVAVVVGLELWQQWQMASPEPDPLDYSLEGTGLLVNGETVDVLKGGPVRVPDMGQNFYWTQYLKKIARHAPDDAWAQAFGRFLCQSWNKDQSDQRLKLNTFTLTRKSRDVGEPVSQSEPWQERVVWEHRCL